MEGKEMVLRRVKDIQQRFSCFIKGKKRKINAVMLPSVMKKVVRSLENNKKIYKPPMSKTIFLLDAELSKLVFSREQDTAASRNKVFGVFSNIISPFMSFLQGKELARSERDIYTKHFKSLSMKQAMSERSKQFLINVSNKSLNKVDLETQCIQHINDFIGDILFGTKKIDVKAYKTLSEKLDDILSQTPVELENPHIVKEVSEEFNALNLFFLNNDEIQQTQTPFLNDIESWYKNLTAQHPELGQFSITDLAPAGRITALGNIMKSFSYIVYQLASNTKLKKVIAEAIEEENVELLKEYVERTMLYYMVTPAVARHVVEDIAHQDIFIKKDSLVLVPMRAIARKKLREALHEVKQKDISLTHLSLEDWIFDLTQPLPNEIKLYRYPFTPFGLGHRKCPAASGFTIMTLMVLTALYSRCSLLINDSSGINLIEVDDNAMQNCIPKVKISISAQNSDRHLESMIAKITDRFYR